MDLNAQYNYSQKVNSSDSLSEFNGKLNSMYSQLTDLNRIQSNAIFRQNDINDILDNENARLLSKKEQINKAAENQNQIIFFNDNNRKLYGAYLKIIITLTITLAIVWIIRVIDHHFGEYIPIAIINILLIVTISTGLIIIYNYYIFIKSRDSYNFDELKLNPPHQNIDKTSESKNGGDLFSSANAKQSCVGSYCCSPPNNGSRGHYGVHHKVDVFLRLYQQVHQVWKDSSWEN